MKYGGQSSVDTLKTVLVKRPDKHFAVEDYEVWGYKRKPNLEIAQQEHDAFTEILRENDVQVLYHTTETYSADSIFVRDPALITDKGALILKMGKELRQGEGESFVHCMKSLGVPVSYLYTILGIVESGDLVWLEDSLLIVGIGFRTNRLGARVLREQNDFEIFDACLPFHKGVEHCLHLTSLISLIGDGKAVAYLPLMPVPLCNLLHFNGFEIISVPDAEFETGAANVLALAPGKCLMLENNPITQKRLEQAGCEVLTFKGEEICLNTEGGPTCLVNPILREKE